MSRRSKIARIAPVSTRALPLVAILTPQFLAHYFPDHFGAARVVSGKTANVAFCRGVQFALSFLVLRYFRRVLGEPCTRRLLQHRRKWRTTKARGPLKLVLKIAAQPPAIDMCLHALQCSA